MLRLRLERQRRGWSQTRLTELTGISTSELSQIERGQRRAFPGWRRRIAAAFNLPEAYLFETVPEGGADTREPAALAATA